MGHGFRAAQGIGVLLSTMGLVACGSGERSYESTTTYAPPIEHRVVVETMVDMPFDQAWNDLIRRLSESPYRVATLEKASRLVVVELNRSSDLAESANTPSRYVDCGKTQRRFVSEEKVEIFEYLAAESSHYRESAEEEGAFRISEVDRRVDLNARATLYLQPEGKRRTRVTVNTRYEIEFELSGDAAIAPRSVEDPIGHPQRFGPRRESIRFTTFQPGKDKRSGELTCRATGDFEHALVALANPAAAI